MRGWTADALRAAALCAAIALLDVIFGAHAWMPFLEWARAPAPTLEAMLLVGLLPLARRSHRPVLVLAVMGLAAAVPAGLSIGEGISLHAFREALDPLHDARFLPALAEVAFGGALWRTIAGIILVDAAALAAASLPPFAVLVAARRAATPRAAAIAVCLAVVVSGALLAKGTPPGQVILHPAVTLLFRSAAPAAAGPAPGVTAPAARPVPAPASSRVAPARDVHLLVLESYGAAVFSNPALRAQMAPAYAELARALRADGIGVRTRLLDSPVFGGRSWIADATIATGTRVADQASYDSLAARAPLAISRLFAGRGYRTVFAAPGTKTLDETWKALFPFDRYVLSVDFGYAGPSLGFGNQPDQFTLGYLLREEAAASERRPIFVDAVLVSSHTPWSNVPAYVADWDAMGDGSLWRDPSRRTSYRTTLAGGGPSVAAYGDSIAYVLTAVEGYAARALGPRGVLFAVGDHEPKYPVSERGASRSVVAHVLSRDPALLDAMGARGWTEGLEASEPPAPVPLESIYAEVAAAAGPGS